ncbi:MAG: DUF4349 domain-containing protein [Clostridia bacterium]|nr:DUF4349 domain-containing protein [Clostridia bacterium]
MKAIKTCTLALAILLMLCCVLTSCSKSYSDAISGGSNNMSSEMAPTVGGDYGYGNSAGKLPETGDTADKETDGQMSQKIIRTVYMDAQTKEFERAISSIREALNTAGGFEESFSSNNRSYGSTGYYSRTATMKLRIPAEKLDAFLSEIGGMLHVTSQRANVQNVTAEYYDIEARLNVLESERAVYESMLQKATSTSEMLSIRDRLYNVIEEIEAYKTRLRVLESQIAYSTVHLTLSEVVEYSKITEQDAAFGDRVYDAFWAGWYNFVDNTEDFTVWFVRNVTTIAILAIIGLLILWIVLANNKKHKPTPTPTPTKASASAPVCATAAPATLVEAPKAPMETPVAAPVETPVEVPEEKPAEKAAEAVVIKPQAPKKDQAAANAQAKIEQIAAKTAAKLAKKNAKFEKKQPKTAKPIAKAKVETPEQPKDETNA